MSTLHICAVTRNKSISATTLHTAMNLHLYCMQRGIHIEIHFMEDRSSLPNIIKHGDRIFWMEYGTNLNNEILLKVIEPFTNGIQLLVFPSVKEGINWEQFTQKTKAGSKEPAGQRGLNFDTTVGKKLADGLYECKSTSARVWAMDAKSISRKIEDLKIPLSSPVEMFEYLAKSGVKIGVASEAKVVCHFVHECFGNILEGVGVKVGP